MTDQPDDARDLMRRAYEADPRPVTFDQSVGLADLRARLADQAAVTQPTPEDAPPPRQPREATRLVKARQGAGVLNSSLPGPHDEIADSDMTDAPNRVDLADHRNPLSGDPDTADRTGLTARQSRVLEVIKDWVDRVGYPPSIQEIGEAAGLTSTSMVAHQLRALERKGYLRRDPHRPRAIGVLPPNVDAALLGEPGVSGANPAAGSAWRRAVSPQQSPPDPGQQGSAVERD